MSIQVSFHCPAEDCVIGTITGEAGALIDAKAISSGYQAEEGYEFDLSAVKDGVQLLCPRCRNPVVIPAGEDEVYAVPGTIRFDERRKLDEARAG